MLTNENGMTPADFSALMGNNRGYGDWGFGGSQGWWILLLFLFAGGWGNGGGFGWGNRGGAVPYMMNENTQAEIQRGFDQQSLMAGIGNLNNTVSNGFANAEVARCNAQMNLMQTLNNNQFGLYQTLNQNQLATYQGLNQLAMGQQVANSANQAGLADLKYTVATENCADRQEINNGIRDIIANQTANTQALINSQTQGFQSIQDKLCQLELDSYKQKVTDQAAEIVALKGAISQTAQTAAIIQDNNAQTANLIRAINPAPIPAYQVPNPVTGCCGNQGYCGCAG